MEWVERRPLTPSPGLRGLADAGLGFLSLHDLQTVFERAAPSVSEQVLTEVVAEADTDGDGRISYRDFERMMKYRVPAS